MTAHANVDGTELIYDEDAKVWKTKDGEISSYDTVDMIADKVIAGDFGKQEKTYIKNLNAAYCEEAVSSILEKVKEKLNVENQEEFIAWRVAIDIHNGLYGQYSNEQIWNLKAANFTEDQINEAFIIAKTIY